MPWPWKKKRLGKSWGMSSAASMTSLRGGILKKAEAFRIWICLFQRFLPNKVLLLRPDGAEGKRLATLSPFVEAILSEDHQPRVYVCEQYACNRPITNVGQLESALHSPYPQSETRNAIEGG